MKTLVLIARIIAIVVIALFVLRFFASAQPPLTAETKRQTVERLAELLPERYAYKEYGPKIQQLLLENLKAGKYASIDRPQEFAAAVTKDLRSINPDRHLALSYVPELPAPASSASPQPLTPEERARRDSVFNRQMNFGFKNVSFLNGNIGYIRLDYFDSYLNYSSPVVDASMQFFKNSDALIIDLRENGGGSGDMVNYVAGFFFKERTLTGSSYNRLTDSTAEEFITSQPKEKQLGDMDLYVLTSPLTVSAAEALAYNLKYLRNARIVGEVSAGAANPGRVTRLNELFTVFIPNRHGKHVVTGTNWEGTGVPVDIPCPADDALRTARIEALKRLRQKATDPLQQKKFDNYITFLQKSTLKTNLPAKDLMQYVGDYEGGRNIILKAGKLYYSRVSEPAGEMFLILPDTFMLSDGDVTLKFQRGAGGKVTELVSQWSLRSSSAVAKKIHD